MTETKTKNKKAKAKLAFISFYVPLYEVEVAARNVGHGTPPLVNDPLSRRRVTEL